MHKYWICQANMKKRDGNSECMDRRSKYFQAYLNMDQKKILATLNMD